ncbi:long-chain-fatty-acid-ligase [Micractinium conductrix]|uniref:Long-chain-fatty-acid-ligase n=1 Tax=Micractinium conductrix TaxID=554055 RepID=A0A2P6VCR6_9CHLO|nr:long-chain-fatty-acid-ligase [Micractinium conductrix]|eukprot:PSC71890.1 long-chain-fatty-acid-ligase [Micractinium conductrix]
MRGLMQEQPLVVTTILDHAERFHGEQEVVSVRCEDKALLTSSWRQVARRAKLAALALKRLGVRPGDRVATLAFNTVQHLEAWYGIMGINAVCHTLNPRLFEADLEFIINHAEDCIIVADGMFAGLLARLLPRCRSVKHIVLLTDERHMPKGGELAEALCYEDLLEDETANLAGFSWEVTDEHQACGLCYTSGTTGPPKGVLYSHRANFLHAFAAALPDSLDLKSSSSLLPVVPMFHANSWGLAFAAPMVGAKLVLPGPYLDGPSMFKLMEEQKVTHTAGVPTVWLGLLEHMEQQRLHLGCLRVMAVGGAACPRRIIDFFEEQGLEVRCPWGMTELAPIGTISGVKGSRQGLGHEALVQLKLKQGRAHVLIDMRIVDDEGKELPWDGKAFGNLQVRGPTSISRYYKAEGPAVDAHQWFDTGDVATIDEFGYMQITDRSKDVIKSGGEWISSIEIENAAMGHPQVAEAAVIALPDKKWGERPLLIVVPRNGQEPSRDSVLRFLEGRVARWWMPDDVAFVKEIPHTATGKISKLALRRQFEGHKPRRSRL